MNPPVGRVERRRDVYLWMATIYASVLGVDFLGLWSCAVFVLVWLFLSFLSRYLSGCIALHCVAVTRAMHTFIYGICSVASIDKCVRFH